MAGPAPLSPRAIGVIQLLERTGARAMQLRYQDDEDPVVWIAVAEYSGRRFEVDAGSSPQRALERLAERLIDGGRCVHCGRVTGLQLEFAEPVPASPMPMCWYVFDPELEVFRRSCEGD